MSFSLSQFSCLEFESLCASSQAHQEEAQEEELITVDAVGCFEGEEEEPDEEEVDVADEEETGGVGTEENASEVPTKQPEATTTCTVVSHLCSPSAFKHENKVQKVKVKVKLCCRQQTHRKHTARNTTPTPHMVCSSGCYGNSWTSLTQSEV